MGRLVSLSAVLVAFALPAAAQPFISGTQLSHACASKAAVEANACDGYIAGVLDAIEAEPSLKGAVCLQPKPKLVTLREALAKYGDQHNSGSGVSLLKDMLKANYPCK